MGGRVADVAVEPGRVIVGGCRQAMPLLRDGFIDPAALPECPAAQVYLETLAGFLATRAASQLCEMAEHTLLIHGDCPGAIAAFVRVRVARPCFRSSLCRTTAR